MNQRAFTLIETLFGVAIFAILVVGSIGFLQQFLEKSKQINSLARADGPFRSFGQKFATQLRGADVALAFQRQPVPTDGCGLEGPCLLKLDEHEKLLPAGASQVGGATTINFFSDTVGALTSKKIASVSGKTRILYSPPANLSALKGTKDRVYAGWTLKDSASPAFVVMTRERTADSFSFLTPLATSNPSAAAGRWVIFQGSRDDLVAQSLIGSLLAIYNGHNTSQFLVQKITNAVSCADSIICQNVAKALNPAFPLTNLTQAPHYALELQALDATMMPGLLQTGGHITTTWWEQPLALYMFPSLTASIYNNASSDFASPLDVRKLAHFYNSEKIKSELMAVPVEVYSYTLKNQTSKKRKLVSKRFSDSKQSVVMEDIPAKQKVVFARLLGTSNVSVFLYEE